MGVVRQISQLLFLVMGIGAATCVPVLAQGGLDVEQLEQKAIYDAASEASKYVVRIETVGGLEKVGKVLVNVGPTSGVIVGEDGYIVSSEFNFIQKPSSILVKLPNGDRKAAEIVSRDASRRLVLLKVDTDESLPIPTAAPVDDIRVGQWAVTVGQTLPGDSFNMSVGIVSAKNRIWGKAVQTDANVSPANYGGALVDIRGQIIGVLVPMSPDSSSVMAGAEWYDSGIGFTVPLETIFANLDRMKEGDLFSGKLGVAMKGSDLYGDDLIVGVCRPKSPAREAGVKAGDKIVGINGEKVFRLAEMKHLLGPLLAGDTVSLEYERDGESLKSDVTLIDKLVPYEHPFLGVLPVRRDESSENAPGVRIRYVYEDSPAAELGIKTDDVITELNGTPIVDPASLREAVAEVELEEDVEIKFMSGDDENTESIILASIPSTVPKELAPVLPDVDEFNEDLPPLGKTNVKLPEEKGECLAYVPENYDPRFEHSMLVVLPIPGKVKADELLQQWKELCDKHHTILLLPQAKEPTAWLPTETAFIRKTIENVRKEYSIDPERIAVYGANSSGAMAYLTALTHRDLIRGVGVLNAPVPRRAPQLINEPLQRLAAFVIGPKEEGRVAKIIELNVKQLQAAKFPVVNRTLDVEKLDEGMKSELLRWVDSLDRI